MMDPQTKNQPPEASAPAPLPQDPAPQGPPDQSQPEGTPLDGIIGQLDSYIKDPKQITPQTLSDLKMQLEDLKSFLEGGDESQQDQGPADSPAPGGLADHVGRFAKSMAVAALLILGAGRLFADSRNELRALPSPTYTSQGVYLSSFTNSVTVQGGVTISSYNAIFFGVNVTSSGQSGANIPSILEVYDSKFSTQPGISYTRRIAVIDTTVKGFYQFSTYCSSGIAIYNQGSPPAFINIPWREK